MDTIVINGKEFIIEKCNKHCDECIFNINGKYPPNYCVMTKCYNFVVIRKVNVIDKIKRWFKKKIKKL